MQRKASAIWKGGLKDGKGVVSSSSGVLSNTPYSFATRFENTPGTNPEELIAAAHAGCFSMALSGQLGAANLTASSIETTATDGPSPPCILTWWGECRAPTTRRFRKRRKMPRADARCPSS
jgi:organic hydroperoxide reductase OsmC/OhrA